MLKRNERYVVCGRRKMGDPILRMATFVFSGTEASFLETCQQRAPRGVLGVVSVDCA